METLEEIKARAEATVSGAKIEIIANPGPASQPSLLIDNDHAVAVARFLRDDPALRFDLCSNVTGVDWLDRTVKKTLKVKKIVDGVEKEVRKRRRSFSPVTSKRFITSTRWRIKHGPVDHSAADERSRRKWRASAVAHSDLAQRRISGAGNFRSLRHPLRWPSRSATHFDVGRIRRFSDAEGLSRTGRLRIRTDAA